MPLCSPMGLQLSNRHGVDCNGIRLNSLYPEDAPSCIDLMTLVVCLNTRRPLCTIDALGPMQRPRAWPFDQIVKSAAVELTVLELVRCESVQGA